MLKHRIKIRQKLTLSAMVLIFVFAISSPARSETGTELNTSNKLSDSLAKAPRWVFDPQSGAGKGEITGLGIAKVGKGGVQEARRKAADWAAKELALIALARVVQFTKDTGDSFELAASIEINELSVQKISGGMAVKDSWISHSGEVFVLGAISEDIIKELSSLKTEPGFAKLLHIHMSAETHDGLSTEALSLRIREGDRWIDTVNETIPEKLSDAPRSGNKVQAALAPPDWVIRGSRFVNGKFYGIGSFPVTDAGVGASIIGALSLARAGILNATTYHLSSGAVPDAIVSGVQQKDIWINPDTKELFVLVVSSTPDFIKTSEADKEKLKNAMEVFKELEKELDNGQ